MPLVTFKAKTERLAHVDGDFAFERVKVPTLTRNHCDMGAFRSHPRFGGFANSDLFAGLLRRQLELMGIGAYIRLDRVLPNGVTVDTSGFLAVVTIDIK